MQDKKRQLQMILELNPMVDDYHVGIRTVEDIKTFKEAMQDVESFLYGDYGKWEAERDLKRRKVVVYSSKDIKDGVFVSTSKKMATEYAGGKVERVKSKEVDIEAVAWINGDEGILADVKNATKGKEWVRI